MSTDMPETTEATQALAWRPERMDPAQTSGLLSLGESWDSVEDIEALGRARAAVAVLERRKMQLALEVAAAREQAEQAVRHDIELLVLAFERARELAMHQATDVAWDIARVLVDTTPQPSRELRQEVLALLCRHPMGSLRVSPTCRTYFDTLMNITVIVDEQMAAGMMEIDLPDGRLELGIDRLRQLIYSDTTTCIKSSTRRVVRGTSSQGSWGDA